mgnify:CR=1 FL=1
MSAANKAKGTKFESDVANYLQSRGVRCKRHPRTGVNDIGDAGFPLNKGTMVLEAKARKSIDLATFVAESLVEAVNYEHKFPAEAPAFGAAVVKRRQKPIGDAYVVLTLDEFVELLQNVGAV